METTTLYKKYPYLPLCIKIAKDYNKLSNRVYCTDDHEFIIQKTAIKDKFTKKITNCPTRVGHNTGNVQINDNLEKMSFSGRLMFLVWAFEKIQFKDNHIENMRTDLDADKKTYSIMSNIPEFKLKDVFVTFIKVLSNVPTETNKLRIEYLKSQLKLKNKT